MKVKKITLRQTRNGTHYQFMVAFRRMIDKYAGVKALVAVLLARFDTLLELESLLVVHTRKLPFTKQLAAEDSRIGRAVVAIGSAIRAGRHHFDPDVVRAARILYIRMNDFGYINSKPYADQSTAVELFVIDLQTVHAAEVAILQLEPLVNELDMAGNAFRTVYNARITELAKLPKDKLTDVRRSIDAVYHKIIEILESDTVLNGDALCGEFLKRQNVNVDEYKKYDHPVRHDIHHADIAPLAILTYTGQAITPLPEVFCIHEGRPPVKLLFSVDYTLTYRNNIMVGNAVIIIHGKGRYKGRKLVTFDISEQ